MNCAEFRKVANVYLDDEAPQALQAAIQAHLKTCTECRRAHEVTERLAAVLHTVPATDVPDGFARRMMTLARQRGIPMPVPVLFYPAQWWLDLASPLRVAAAAVLVVGLAMGTLMGLDVGQSSYTAPTIAKTDALTQYNLDYMGDAPRGSLAQVFLTIEK